MLLILGRCTWYWEDASQTGEMHFPNFHNTNWVTLHPQKKNLVNSMFQSQKMVQMKLVVLQPRWFQITADHPMTRRRTTGLLTLDRQMASLETHQRGHTAAACAQRWDTRTVLQANRHEQRANRQSATRRSKDPTAWTWLRKTQRSGRGSVELSLFLTYYRYSVFKNKCRNIKI